MTDSSNLESLSHAEGVIKPPAFLRQAAYLQDLEATHRQSIEHNEAFWANVADELDWFRKWDTVFQSDYPRFQWFVGGKCNITANALDRHANSWRKNKVALIWIGEDGREETVSYGQLLRRVNRVANGLKSIGVSKGDRKVGKPLPGVVADVVDLEGKPVAAGRGGFLVLKQPFPHMFRTVYGDPERYERDWNRIAGCYFTGDVAIKDTEGYFMVVGRADDVMNVAGHRIGTAEVESSLVSHSAVAEAAVIGKPDALKGESIKAFVSLSIGYEPSPNMVDVLRRHVRGDLGPIAQPGEIDFVDKLPKTRSGKIMRRLLKANELGLDPGDITTLED